MPIVSRRTGGWVSHSQSKRRRPSVVQTELEGRHSEQAGPTTSVVLLEGESESSAKSLSPIEANDACLLSKFCESHCKKPILLELNKPR
jgi:hypothetical protein